MRVVLTEPINQLNTVHFYIGQNKVYNSINSTSNGHHSLSNTKKKENNKVIQLLKIIFYIIKLKSHVKGNLCMQKQRHKSPVQ